MGKIIRFFISFIICIFVINSASVEAVGPQKILVVSLDNQVFDSSYSIYPQTTNLLASDIINSLRSNSIQAIDLVSAQKTLKSPKLSANFNKFSNNYKQTYSIDYDLLQKIGKEFGVSKAVLLIGGFDTQTAFLKESSLNWLNIPGRSVINSQVTYNLIVSLVSLDDRTVIWEENYSSNFSGGDFATKEHGFAENFVPVASIKKYSAYTSPQIAAKIKFMLTDSGITTNSGYTSNTTTDGITTKDGHYYSTDPQRVKDIRGKNYKTRSINEL